MLRHEDVWTAIDALAKEYGLSPSGLARRAGLDPTTFNKSKRFTREGKPRWPSTESIAKILKAVGATMADFTRFLPEGGNGQPVRVPVIGLAQAGNMPQIKANQEVATMSVPDTGDPEAFALKISGACMAPAFLDGEFIVVSPRASAAPGDRVVIRTKAGEVVTKELVREDAAFIEVRTLYPRQEERVLARDEIDWMARVMWTQH